MVGLEGRKSNVEKPSPAKSRQTTRKRLQQILVACHLLVDLKILVHARFLESKADEVCAKKIPFDGVHLLNLSPRQFNTAVTFIDLQPLTVLGQTSIFPVFKCPRVVALILEGSRNRSACQKTGAKSRFSTVDRSKRPSAPTTAMTSELIVSPNVAHQLRGAR